MKGDPPGPRPPAPETTRRAEVEAARRTPPVQTLRAGLKGLKADDETIRRLADAIRSLLRRD